jgi:hypothetical protein
VQNSVIDKLLLTPANQDIIGGVDLRYEIPEYKIYKFLNFSNPEEFYLSGKNPEFRKIPGEYRLKKVKNVYGSERSSNREQVTFNIDDSWVEDGGSAGIKDQKIVMPNLPSLDLWQSLKALKPANRALMHLGNIKYYLLNDDGLYLEMMANLMVADINSEDSWSK